MRTPGFTAEVSLNETPRSYRSRVTLSRGGRDRAAAPNGLVLPAWCAGVMCRKNDEGYFECDCIDEVWM
jgi:hypothetical protein